MLETFLLDFCGTTLYSRWLFLLAGMCWCIMGLLCRGEIFEGRRCAAAPACGNHSNLLLQRPGRPDQLGHGERPHTHTYTDTQSHTHTQTANYLIHLSPANNKLQNRSHLFLMESSIEFYWSSYCMCCVYRNLWYSLSLGCIETFKRLWLDHMQPGMMYSNQNYEHEMRVISFFPF